MDSSYLVRKLLGSTRRFLLFVLIIALFILTGVGAAYFVFGREGRGVSILPSNPNLPATGGDGQSEIGDVTQKLTVNAQLQVNGQFKLTPTSVPQTAAPGTIIFDQETSTLLYHNGTEFVSVESQQPLPPAGVTSLQGQTGAVNLTAGAGIAINGTTITATGGSLTAVNGTAGHVNVVTSGGVATLSLPQPIGVTETPTFAGLNLSGDMVLDSAAFLFGNNISQTAPGQDVAVSAGNDAIIFTSGGRMFEFPTSGPASQTICTTGISCAAGGGQAVLVAPGSAQTDNTADVSIFINDTGGGNLIQLQSGAADRFVVAANGNATISGSLTLGTALGLGSGGTGATTAQGAINAISGLTTNGDLLYHNGVNSTRLARGTNGQCLISTGATIQWDTCTGAGGVSSLNSFNGAITLQGTTNQITVNNNAGTITLSTPQDINTGASPTFAGMTLNGALSVATGGISVTGNSTITGTLGSLTGLSSSGTIQFSSLTTNGFVKTTGGNGTLTVSASVDLSAEVTGTLAVGNGGTGATTAQGAINALSGLTTTGDILYYDGANTTRLPRGTNGQCLLSTGATVQWDTCTGAGGVSALNTFTGAVTLQGTANQVVVNNNAGTITLSTPQDINTNSSPTFSGLTLSSLIIGGDTISDFTGTGLQVVGNSLQTTLGIDIDLTAEVTGVLPIANGGTNANNAADARINLGAAASGANSDITSTTALNTITPSGALTIGATSQSFTLQGTSASVLTAADSGNTTTIGFVTPTADVTINFPALSAGTYQICTTSGNCLGAGGGANTSLSNLSSVAINTSLLPGATNIDLGSGANPFRDLYLGGTATNNFRIMGSASAARTITLPDASGEICLNTGNCVGSGGGSAPSGASYITLGLSGDLTAERVLTAGTNIQINDGGANDNLTVSTVDNPTFSTSVTTPQLTSSGALSITSSGALSVGSSSQTLTLQGSSSSSIVITDGANSTTLDFETPTASATIQFPALAAGTWEVCTSAGNCTSQAGVDSINTFTGDIVLQGTTNQISVNNNAGTITLSTPQDINTAATPTFGGLTLNGALSVTSGGLSVTGNSTITGTLGSLTGLASSGTIQFSSLTTDGFVKTSSGDGTLTVATAIDLATEVTGTLSVTNGGTGATTAQNAINTLSGLTTTGDLLYYDGANTTRLARGSDGQCLVSNSSTIEWAACPGSGAGDILQGGNNLGGTTAMVLGTTNNGDFNIITNNTTALTVDTSQNATFNGNVVVAASQSLRLTGGNTASRPGSPAEGMVYFDTDTNRLLTYAGGKWQADRTDAVLVAASNSSQSDKDAADYVADGTSDEDEINSALTAAAGKKVVLLAGTYVADGTILVPNNTTLAGVGNGTLIQLADLDATDNLIEASGSNRTGQVIRDLRLDGRSDLNTAGTQYGIFLDGVGSASPYRVGATVTNVDMRRFRSAAVRLEAYYSTIANNNINESDYGISSTDSSYNTITGNTIRSNTNYGIYLLSTSARQFTISGNAIIGNGNGIYLPAGGSLGHNITGNTVSANTGYGIYVVQGGSRYTITGNKITGNVNGIYVHSQYSDHSSYNTITGNTVNDNTNYGIYLAGNHNTVTGNVANNNTAAGIYLNGSTAYGFGLSNTVSSNNIHSNGGTTANSGIYLNDTDFNSIANNSITDTACTTTCFAINISSSASDKNYLEGNRFSGSSANAASINDAGTGTIYVNQQTNSTTSTNSDVSDFLFRGSANSTTAFAVQNASGANILNVDTTNGEVEVGSSSTAGTLVVTSDAQASLRVVDSSSNTIFQTGYPDSGTAELVLGNNTVNNTYITLSTVNNDWSIFVDDNTDSGLAPQDSLAFWLGATPVAALTGAGELILGGSLSISDGSSNYATITVDSLSGDYSVAIPTITANDTFCLEGLGNCTGGDVSSALSDNTSNALNIQEGTNNYININTTNGSEEIQFGNINTNPDYAFLGSGTLSVSGVVNIAGQITIGTSDTTGTLLVLDTKTDSGDPSGVDGAMYYNSDMGKFRCYEDGEWVDCITPAGAGSNRLITLRPEYEGVVFSGSGIGYLTASACGNQNDLSLNTGVCGSSEHHNYYEWTTVEASAQSYSMYIRYQLPSDFDGFTDDSTIRLYGRRTNSTASVAYTMYEADGDRCGSVTTVTSSNNTWQEVSLTGNETSCTFAAGDIITFQIDMTAESGSIARVGELRFTYISVN